MTQLTTKQQEAFDYILEFTGIHGYPPTRKEIATRFSIHPSTAKQRCQELESKGAIEITENTPRGIRVTL